MEVVQRALQQPSRLREPTSVQVFCWAILAAALAGGLTLALLGASWPPVVPVLLLVLAAGLCVNRFALFPSEHAATAEAAVLLAAVVGFRSGGVFLGPLVVALLVGPLDVLHWRQRSVLRMAHNAGNRGLSVLAASGAFVGVGELAGSSGVALTVAVIAASACFAAVDLLLSSILLSLQGSPARTARRDILEVDALTLPIACYGAAVGFLAATVGWWATALALVPAAFIPELVLSRRRWRAAVARDVFVGVLTLATLAAVAWLAPIPAVRTLAAVAVVSVLVGIELGIEGRASVPSLVVLALVPALVVADGDEVFFAAALAAVGATVTGWCVSRSPLDLAMARPTAVAVGAALVAAAIFASGSPSSTAGLALVAGVGFESTVIIAGTPDRRRVGEMFWTAPLVCVAVAGAGIWRALGLGGALAFVGVCTFASAATADFGAPPWRSRVLAHAVAPPRVRHRVTLGVVCALIVSLAVAGLLVDGHTARVVVAWSTVAFGEAGLAMSLVGVRQWRFAPRARFRDAAVVSVAALLLLLAVGPSTSTAAATRARTVLVALAVVATVLAVGLGPARRADEVAQVDAEVGSRERSV